MASRAQQKEQARQRRLAEEQARAGRARRQRRLQLLLGVVVAAVAVVVIAVAIGLSGNGASNNTNVALKPNSSAAQATAAKVNTLLTGIPQAGNRLGAPTAKVNVTEYGDLECPVCAAFALNAEQTLIQNDVRSGKVSLTYRSLCTATCSPASPNQSLFPTQQAAALAAGLQGKEWAYVELFYHEQGKEDTAYVTDAYLNGLARQVSGLNYAKWLSDRGSSAMTTQVTNDEQAASSLGFNATPTLVIRGPKGQAQPIQGDTSYQSLESAIKSVS